MNTFTLPGTDGIFIQGKLYSKKKLCLDWFKMSNDNFTTFTDSISIHMNTLGFMTGEEKHCMESEGAGWKQ